LHFQTKSYFFWLQKGLNILPDPFENDEHESPRKTTGKRTMGLKPWDDPAFFSVS